MIRHISRPPASSMLSGNRPSATISLSVWGWKIMHSNACLSLQVTDTRLARSAYKCHPASHDRLPELALCDRAELAPPRQLHEPALASHLLRWT
jgi:hypothetical protein